MQKELFVLSAEVDAVVIDGLVNRYPVLYMYVNSIKRTIVMYVCMCVCV